MEEAKKGLKINMLALIEESPEDKKFWFVRCDCGNTCKKRIYDVLRGHTKSCGCLHKKETSKARKIHGETDTRLYYIWENMKKRCLKPNSDRYKNYGGRGISICYEWLDYQNFSKWAHSSGYKDNLTLERIGVNGDYEPKNCTWIVAKEQAKNRTSNKLVFINGEKLSPHELETRYGIPIKTIYARLARGDEGEAVVRPLGVRQFYKR